jgi:hypothetical protein
MIGSGMQQARDFRKRRTVEVVRNHEDGKVPWIGNPGTARRATVTPRVEATRLRFRQDVDGGDSTRRIPREAAERPHPVRGVGNDVGQGWNGGFEGEAKATGARTIG